MSKQCTICTNPAIEGLGICEECANRFCAWIEGVCTHKWRYKGIEQKCILCGEWRGDVELTDYIHDSNAMLDRVMPKAWERICGMGKPDTYNKLLDDFLDRIGACCFVHGQEVACHEFLQALMQTPLWTEFLETLEEE